MSSARSRPRPKQRADASRFRPYVHPTSSLLHLSSILALRLTTTVFIQELTARSHLISLESRRRTLSRPDVATAVSKSDMFDFLIDIIPRDEAASGGASGTATPAEGVRRGRKGKGSAKKRSRKTSADGDDDDGTYGEEDGTPMGSEMGTEADYASATGEQDAPVQQSGKKARIENLVDGGFHQVSCR